MRAWVGKLVAGYSRRAHLFIFVLKGNRQTGMFCCKIINNKQKRASLEKVPGVCSGQTFD